MSNLSLALIMADLLLAYGIHQLHKHNDKVDQVFADPDSHIITQKTEEKRDSMKVDMLTFYFLFVVLIVVTILHIVSNWGK